MIIGFVSPDFRPLIRCVVQGSHGVDQEIEAWVDTGFNGAMLVPPEVIGALDLAPNFAINVKLANGAEVEMITYTATVLWNDEPRRIQLLSAEHHALVGLRLLQQHQLTITFTDGGAVIVEPLQHEI
jgi:clan AA aspartic protease